MTITNGGLLRNRQRPSKEANIDPNLMLVLDDPKSIFYRIHADIKQYHVLGFETASRGIITPTLNTRQLNLQPLQRMRITEQHKNIIGDLKAKFSPPRLSLHRFNLDTIGVDYSLSKRKRWLFEDHFKQNIEDYQFDDVGVSTVLAISEFPFYHYVWNADDSGRIKRLISSDQTKNGDICIRENSRNRGFMPALLDSLPSTTKGDNQELVRIIYHIVDPKTSYNQLNGSKDSIWNSNSIVYGRKAYGRSWRKKTKRTLKNRFPPLDSKYYVKDEDELENIDIDEVEDLPKPQSFTLADYIDPILFSDEDGFEDYVFFDQDLLEQLFSE